MKTMILLLLELQVNHISIKKNHFHKNPLYFWMNADFEADNEFDKSGIVKKTTNTFNQNPVLYGYEKVSELDDILKNG